MDYPHRPNLAAAHGLDSDCAEVDGPLMLSASTGSIDSAFQELRDEFGPEVRLEKLGPDFGVVSGSPGVRQVAAACLQRPLVFITHLSVEIARIPRPEADDLQATSRLVLSALLGLRIGAAIAVQTWVSGSPSVGYGSAQLHSRLREGLETSGVSVYRAGQERVLSACITPRGVSVGLNGAGDSLCDWPGGRLRLARSRAQVSRAEFKLEELLRVFPISLPQGGRGLDLGASPGGWTRILRQEGMSVWAVDPANLDRRLSTDPHVHHVRATAGTFLRSTDMLFDLVVNDMRMDPLPSSRTMLDAARHLTSGGIAILTLKTGPHGQLKSTRQSLAVLSRGYEILHARQLHHNRQEVTVVARRK